MVVAGGMEEVPKAVGAPGTSKDHPSKWATPYNNSLFRVGVRVIMGRELGVRMEGRNWGVIIIC